MQHSKQSVIGLMLPEQLVTYTTRSGWGNEEDLERNWQAHASMHTRGT